MGDTLRGCGKEGCDSYVSERWPELQELSGVDFRLLAHLKTRTFLLFILAVAIWLPKCLRTSNVAFASMNGFETCWHSQVAVGAHLQFPGRITLI